MFNENTRVKIPALVHLERLGFKYLSLKDAVWDTETNIFSEIFNGSLQRLNPNLSSQEIESQKKRILATLENEDLGKEFYEHLISQSQVKLIDFEKFENNVFNCVTELEFQNGLDAFRPDITILINGLPLIFIEVKKPNNANGILSERIRLEARLGNKNFKKIFNLTQFMIYSNNMEYDSDSISPIQGAFYATTSKSKAIFNCFREEILDFDDQQLLTGEVNEEHILADNNLLSLVGSKEFAANKSTSSPTNRILTSMLSRERLAFFLKYSIAYINTANGIEKHIMRYPQVFASIAIESKIAQGQSRGVIWHTQGSGKTALAYYNTRLLTDYFRKVGKVAKFYFIVDRIDLLLQAQREFLSRNLHVNTANSKAEFMRDFTSRQAISNQRGQSEITVVNIQKFADDRAESLSNDYDLNVQRIYFIDEAHRSYKADGSFLANLISSDRNAVLICLTGTPLLGESASTKIFGSYFHKYFYNASISDGYTLRLIREEISTRFKSEIGDALKSMEVRKGQLSQSQILAHENFVSPMLEYITSDLQRSRMLFGDQTIGGMVICDSSEQAKKMKEIFDSKAQNENGTRAALILHDVGTKDDRKSAIEDFKNGKIDLLFVYNMLLTGFDSPRLKKLYVGRVVREHNLLQAVTRVNRPYRDFKFGYVVDFADIRKEFDATNAAYFKELQTELGDYMESYSNLFISEAEIEETILRIKNELFDFDLENPEAFSKQINDIKNKTKMANIVKTLEDGRNLFNVIKLIDTKAFVSDIAFNNIRLMHNEARNHLALLNLAEKVDSATDTTVLLNTALEDVAFMFHKESEAELKIGHMRNMVRAVRETLDRNIDKTDAQFLFLIEELRRLLMRSNITERESPNYDADVIELEEILSKAREINLENERLASKYYGDSKFVRLHKRLATEVPSMNNLRVMNCLNELRHQLNEIVTSNRNILSNRGYFEAAVESVLANTLEDYPELDQTLNLTPLKLHISAEYFSEFEGAAA